MTLHETGNPRSLEPWGARSSAQAFLLGTVSLAVAGGLLVREARSGWNGFTYGGALLLLAGGVGALEAFLRFRTRSKSGLGTALERGGSSCVSTTTVLVGMIMAVMLYLFRDNVVDDSYITYRYARNIVRGLGVVWNPGDPPVEGYSNFLWMIAHAMGLRAGLEPLALSRLLGALSYAGCGFMVFRLARALGAETRHAAVATILFSLVPSFPFWAMSGLETTSVVLFALLFFHGLALEWPDARWPWRTALWGVVLVLSRPDGLLIVGVALGALLWPPDPSRWKWLLRCMALLAPPVVIYQVWRQLTFGTPTPNTLSAKLQSMAGDVLVTDFLSLIFPLLLLLALLARVRGLGSIERAILAVTAAYVLAGLNIMSHVSHAQRFFLPVMGPLLALSALLAREWSALGPSRSRWAGRLALALVVLYAVAPTSRLAFQAGLEATSLRQAHLVVGQELKRTFSSSELLAASDCGLMPYVSDMRTLDIWGLTDRVIATQGFSATRIMEAKPDAIVLHSLDQGLFRGREFYDRALHPLIMADSAYRLVDRRPVAGYTLWVFSTRPLR